MTVSTARVAYFLGTAILILAGPSLLHLSKIHISLDPTSELQPEGEILFNMFFKITSD